MRQASHPAFIAPLRTGRQSAPGWRYAGYCADKYLPDRDILTRLHDEAVYLPISYISMMVVSKPELGNIPYAPIATEIPFEQIKPVKP